jgi:Tfp pilus assembly protein PilN
LSGRLRDKFLIGTVAASIIALAAVGVLYTTQTAKEAELTERRDVALRDSARYATFLKDRYRAEATRDSLLRQVNIIRSLDEDRFVWPHILDEISRALPQYTWLSVLGFAGTPQGSNNIVITPVVQQDTSAAARKRNKPPKRIDTAIPKDVITIRLLGRTVDIQAVTRFMRDLGDSPYFTNIVLDKSEPVQDQGKDVAQFQLTIGYRRPDTLQLRRAPLSLSVK